MLPLRTPDTRNSEHLVFHLQLSPVQITDLYDSRGEKYEFYPRALRIGGQEVKLKSVELHGQSTLYYPRKSLTFKLTKKFSFEAGNTHKSLRRFFMLSLSMDHYYFHNLLAFRLMEKLDLFGLFYTLAELRLNENSAGIYLMVQRPVDYAMRDLEAPFLIRRAYQGGVSDTKYDADKLMLSRKKYLKQFREIYHLPKKLEGEALYNSLNQHLDLPAYFRWLAFNTYVQNGDYADEIYFYALPDATEVRYHIIPWDYDDILSPHPHEGTHERNRSYPDKLIFSIEDPLDRAIAGDAYLYRQYLLVFRDMLTRLTPDVLASTVEGVYHELYPFYTQPEIIASSARDQYGRVSLDTFIPSLRQAFQFLVNRRSKLLAEIDAQLAG